MQWRPLVVHGRLVLDADRLAGLVEQDHLFHVRYLLSGEKVIFEWLRTLLHCVYAGPYDLDHGPGPGNHYA
ncbi:hypothetical protein GCM10009854_21760 [Saccharopolyspora halophila]|uniref:Uncharacterized protein n=1 Tax=Saccharopolyspora halophila TaxID=405551 RepID=A0ABN3G5I6_9PSEU